MAFFLKGWIKACMRALRTCAGRCYSSHWIHTMMADGARAREGGGGRVDINWVTTLPQSLRSFIISPSLAPPLSVSVALSSPPSAPDHFWTRVNAFEKHGADRWLLMRQKCSPGTRHIINIQTNSRAPVTSFMCITDTHAHSHGCTKADTHKANINPAGLIT